MKGYHYTTKENWKNIQRCGGLIPYEIKNNRGVIKEFTSSPLCGIWTWTSSPKGLSHAGNVMRVAATHDKVNVVKLEIQYHSFDVLTSNKGERIALMHIGEIENLIYHREEEAVIVTKKIPLSDIKVIGEYDIIDALK